MLIEHPEMLVGVNDKFLFYVRALFKTLPYDYEITAGIRTQAQEDALYAQGRTAPGEIVTWTEKSAHIAGLAIDVVLMRNGTEIWNMADPGWQALFTAVRASGWLHGGIDFPKGETDAPHIEAYWWAHYTATYGPPASEAA